MQTSAAACADARAAASPRLIAHAARRCWIARGVSRRPVRLRNKADGSPARQCRTPRQPPAQGLARRRADGNDALLGALAPDAHFACRQIERRDVESGKLGDAQPATNTRARTGRDRARSASHLPVDRDQLHGFVGRKRGRKPSRRFRGPQSGAGIVLERRIAVDRKAVERAPRGQHPRQGCVPERPRACSVARKRRISRDESPASGRSPASDCSAPRSRRYASRVWAGRVDEMRPASPARARCGSSVMRRTAPSRRARSRRRPRARVGSGLRKKARGGHACEFGQPRQIHVPMPA